VRNQLILELCKVLDTTIPAQLRQRQFRMPGVANRPIAESQRVDRARLCTEFTKILKMQ